MRGIRGVAWVVLLTVAAGCAQTYRPDVLMGDRAQSLRVGEAVAPARYEGRKGPAAGWSDVAYAGLEVDGTVRLARATKAGAHVELWPVGAAFPARAGYSVCRVRAVYGIESATPSRLNVRMLRWAGR